MIRNFCFGTITALGLLTFAACGDDGMGATGATATTGTTTSGGGSTTTAGTTTSDDPTTTGGTTAPGTTTSDEDPTTGPGTTTNPGTTTDPGTTTEPGTTTDPGTTGPGTTTDDEVAQCKMMLPDPNDACGNCACENCLEELQACQADEGCTAIRECAQANMCSGFDCLGPCGDVINDHGGPLGASGMLGLTLNNCIQDANCPC